MQNEREKGEQCLAARMVEVGVELGSRQQQPRSIRAVPSSLLVDIEESVLGHGNHLLERGEPGAEALGRLEERVRVSLFGFKPGSADTELS